MSPVITVVYLLRGEEMMTSKTLYVKCVRFLRPLYARRKHLHFPLHINTSPQLAFVSGGFCERSCISFRCQGEHTMTEINLVPL